jgi:ADP-ribose pyrophosphatase YjhB (NUDIX family)
VSFASALDLRAVSKAPAEGEEVAEEGKETAERAAEGLTEAVGHGIGHGSHGGHGHGGKPHGEKKPKGEHGKPAAEHGHAAAGGHASGGGEHHEAAKPKPKGGGGGPGRDEHGRFASKRAAYRVAIRRSFEGAWGGRLPMFDRQTDEQGDFETAHANQNKAAAPAGLASPGDFGDGVDYENPSATGADFPEMVADGGEALFDLGETTSDDPDDGLDGGGDPADDQPPPTGADDEDGLGPSIFDQPTQQTITGRADPVDVTDGFADHPWGEPSMFTDGATFEDPADTWYTARAKADLPDAAICVVFDADGDVLTISRPEPPHEQSIPGGLVDPGETPDQAAARELFEECGVEVHDVQQVGIVRSPTDGRRVFVFVASGASGDAYAAEPNTVVEWLPPQALLAQASLYRATVRELMSAGLLSPRAQKGYWLIPGVTGRPLEDGLGPVVDAVKAVWDRALAEQHLGPVDCSASAGVAVVSWAAKSDAPGPQVLFQGIPVIIDRPAGYVQTGVDDCGCAWTRTYLYDYGYIPGTEGGDGEGLDVYLGPAVESPFAFWAVQTDRAGCFDEYKVFLGFGSIEDAADAYVAHTPVELLGAIFTTDTGALKALLGRDPR